DVVDGLWLRDRHGAAVAVHRTADQWHGGDAFRRAQPVDAGWHRFSIPSTGFVLRWLAGRLGLRPDRQLRSGVADFHCPQPAGRSAELADSRAAGGAADADGAITVGSGLR